MKNICKFIELKNSTSKHVCSVCGKEQTHYGRPCDMVVRICKKSLDVEILSLSSISIPCTESGIEKTTRWIRAVKRWTVAGCPNRSDGEVASIYEICSGEISRDKCGFFNDHGSCKLCGCKLSKSKIAFFNKIRMATENCPKNKW